VVGGKKLLTSFERSDRILEIEPVIEWQESAKHLVTDDTNTILEDGDGLFTFIMVELALESPEGAEFFFGLIKDGFFEVDYESSSFISDTSLKGEICSFENFEARKDGAVWVRTAGYGTGKVFISRDERTASVVHSVIGHIQQGIELIHMAGKGHSIFVKTDPAPINILGMGFKEAEKHLEGLGVELVREGYKEDDANIVKLNPSSTIDILLAKKVIATGAPDSLVIRVELYDELAPKSVDFFRHAVGLTFRPIGTLPVMMIYEDTYLFKAAKSAEKYKEILPENVLVDKTKAFEIGITNQAAKRMGIVGVKTEDDDLFGPTGEKFSSTNIIGKILEPEKFKALTEKDTMYVLESNKEEIE
ncbi:MAG: methanoproteinis marker protein 3, partial [Methanohalophilus sp. T328-1]